VAPQNATQPTNFRWHAGCTHFAIGHTPQQAAKETTMSKKTRRPGDAALDATEATSVFHQADVLYALEWAAVAPGLGGWNLVLDDEKRTRLVSVIPPGAENPAFFITRQGGEVTITWLRQKVMDGSLVEVGRFGSLREAVLTLCPLCDDLKEVVNEAMEALYPRSLRGED
jgi:hypothetical protein